MRASFEIDCWPGGSKCRWCERTPRWSTTAYSGNWDDLCDDHLAKLLRRIKLRRLHFDLPEPVVVAEAAR